MFPFTRTVLIFFIPGLLFIVPRARRTLGAYRIPREAGLLVSSVLAAYRKRARNSFPCRIFQILLPARRQAREYRHGKNRIGNKINSRAVYSYGDEERACWSLRIDSGLSG
jgi:hypothetical protein